MSDKRCCGTCRYHIYNDDDDIHRCMCAYPYEDNNDDNDDENSYMGDYYGEEIDIDFKCDDYGNIESIDYGD